MSPTCAKTKVLTRGVRGAVPITKPQVVSRQKLRQKGCAKTLRQNTFVATLEP